jgi:hypothetical protein
MTAVLEGTGRRDVRTAPKSGLRRALTETPNQLTLLTIALVLLGLVLGLVSALGLLRDSSSLSSLKARTTEVTATSDLYYRLNDMDAQAANALLVGYHPAAGFQVPASVDAQSSDATYNADRSAADADLALISENPSLNVQASKLLDTLGSYEADIADAFYIDGQAVDQKPATPPATAVSAYKAASAMLHDSMLPASLNITTQDSTEVDGSYSSDHSAMKIFGYVTLWLAVLTVLALLLGNRYYARRFRRRLSLLAVGALVALVSGVISLSTQLGDANHLQVAKQSAYDSIYALDRARAVSDDANADESRWLLEGLDPSLQTSFFQKESEVAGIPGVSASAAAANPSSYYSALSSAAGALHVDGAANTVSGVTIDGFLGTELGNVTFPGEAAAAATATRDFNAYLQDDGKIRADANGGNLAGAVTVDIGLSAGQSNFDFNTYMTAVGHVIQINTQGFDAAVSAGQSGLGATAWSELLIAELLLLGLITQAGYLRLREYR